MVADARVPIQTSRPPDTCQVLPSAWWRDRDAHLQGSRRTLKTLIWCQISGIVRFDSIYNLFSYKFGQTLSLTPFLSFFWLLTLQFLIDGLNILYDDTLSTRFILKFFQIATFISCFTSHFKSSSHFYLFIYLCILNKGIDIRALHQSSTTQPASTLLFQPLLPGSQDAFRGPPPSFHLLCCSFVSEISSFIFITKFQSPSPHPQTLHSPSFFSFMVPKGRIPGFPSHHPPSRNPSNWPYECPQMTHRLPRNKGWQMCSQN